MGKQHYFLKLIPPRPTFPSDMSDQERGLMQEHVAYMAGQFAAGKVLIYGPVMEPGAPFGMGVFEVDDLAEARRIIEADPTVVAGLNRFTLCPMRVGHARGT